MPTTDEWLVSMAYLAGRRASNLGPAVVGMPNSPSHKPGCSKILVRTFARPRVSAASNCNVPQMLDGREHHEISLAWMRHFEQPFVIVRLVPNQCHVIVTQRACCWQALISSTLPRTDMCPEKCSTPCPRHSPSSNNRTCLGNSSPLSSSSARVENPSQDATSAHSHVSASFPCHTDGRSS